MKINPKKHIAFFVNFVFLILLSIVPSTTRADFSFADKGRIDIGPGWRYESLRGSSSLGGAGRFGWYVDERYMLALEMGIWSGMLDPSRFFGENLSLGSKMRIMVGDLRFSLSAHIFRWGSVLFYGLGGLGYHIVGINAEGSYKEGATQGLFLGGGIYLPISERVGFFVEDRYTFFARIQAQLGNEMHQLDAGGNMLWAGLILFFEPQPRPAGLGVRRMKR